MMTTTTTTTTMTTMLLPAMKSYLLFLVVLLFINNPYHMTLAMISEQQQQIQHSSANSIIEDDIHFDLKWPGLLVDNFDGGTGGDKLDLIDVKTRFDERYRCYLPQDLDERELNELNKPKISAAENSVETSRLFDALYAKKICSYRIESYWVYELCHGQFVRQYHETKQTGKKPFSVEYYLGHFNALSQEPDYIKDNENKLLKPNIHWKTLDGKSVPTYAVKYLDGTKCDILNNKPREIVVYYACEEAGNENIVGFEEVSSCVYEMIVVSRIICDHPAYKLPEKSKKAINCYSADPAQQQSKPRELEQFEEARDSLLKQAQNRIRMTNRDGDTFIIHYKTIDTNEEANNDDVAAAEPDEQQQQQTATPPNQPYTPPPPHQAQATISDEAEREVIQSFISGVSCLTGGVGWWKYEVCIGRQVNQFHEDETTKKRQSIRLGSWNKNDHLEWLRSHPNKRPLTNVNDRTTVTHYFSNGDRCEENNRSRFVELKLKCIRTREKSHAVSLYLMEPATCEYILTIESPWLCEYVESADMNGLANVFYAEDSTDNNPTVVP